MRIPFVQLPFIFLLLLASQVRAVDFEKQIQPVLEAKCLSCHNPNLRKGKLSLSTLSEIRDADEGLLISGNHRDSLLHQVTIPLEPGEKPEMPKKGEALTEAEAKLLAEWIDEGANWPEGIVLREASKADASWWAFQALRKFDAKDSIDGFIDEKLSEKGLSRNDPASARELIRRVTYDLHGLPPSPEEAKRFEESTQSDFEAAYTALINRLLASPRYGERWGRHWLDVVRFGESKGYERNVILDNIWPFRDYVIRSLNEDKPFDQLITEHLAGDVVGKGNPDIEVGTVFLVAGPYDDVGNKDAKAAAIIRANTLDGMITATGSAFMGLTVNCAKCHDHKFDPIEQKDYYRLRAAFEGVKQGERVMAKAEDRKAHAELIKPLNDEKGKLNKAIKELENAAAKRVAESPSILPEVTRSKMDRTGTTDEFPSVLAKAIRLTPYSNDSNPNANSVRIDEFEVWTDETESRNVALSSNGGTAEAQGRKVEDSAENAANAYGPVLVNDGEFGKRWISSGNPTLTIHFSKPEKINRVVYSSDRPAELPTLPKMVFVGEYKLEVSTDSENWKIVSESWNRPPLNKLFLRSRQLRFGASKEEKSKLASLKKELSTVEAKLGAIKPLPTVWAGNFVQPEKPTHLAVGGDPNKPADEVVPASFAKLPKEVPAYALTSKTPEAERRHELAKWICHPDNPLTLRVLANRVWHYHFGTGIVNTPSDFGYMGGKPSHPELLDFLASRLKKHSWKWKPLHREILLSKTYRQSADYRKEAASIDADSRLLWRVPPRRLSAEEIRDSILTIAGKLNLNAAGGPGFRLYKFTQDNVCTYFPLDHHGPETWRRAVYHQNPRAATMDLLTDFDCPDPALATPRRATTTTPLQALTLMNHSFTTEMAGFFAARLEQDAEDIAGRVNSAFQLAFGRPPTEHEREAAVKVVRDFGLPALTRTLLNSNELIYVN